MHFKVFGVGQKVLRAIHLRSFSFFLAFFTPGGRRSEVADFSTAFLSNMPATVLLSPSRTAADVLCNGTDAWKSLEGARENQIISR